MRKILLTADRFMIYYGAISGNPEGFKGLQAIKNGLGVLSALELLGHQDEKTKNWLWTPVDIGVPQLELTEDQFSCLRSSMDSMVWTGQALRLVEDAFLGLEQAI